MRANFAIPGILAIFLFSLSACAGQGGSDAGAGASGGASKTFAREKSHRLRIEFDYRFDQRGFFNDPVRRKALEAAAGLWSARISDDFPTIAGGTPLRTRNPQKPKTAGQTLTRNKPIDDLLVFVGCTRLPGDAAAISNHTAAIYAVSDLKLRERLRQRYEGDDFEPWTGWIAFDCDYDWFFDPTPTRGGDVPAGRPDFVSTAIHELAHVLGFGTAKAFIRQVDGRKRFNGPRAVAVNGAPVPLDRSAIHLDPALAKGGPPLLMAPSRMVGRRTLPGPLERAMLEDIGYEIRPPSLQRFDMP